MFILRPLFENNNYGGVESDDDVDVPNNFFHQFYHHFKYGILLLSPIFALKHTSHNKCAKIKNIIAWTRENSFAHMKVVDGTDFHED